MGQFTVTKVTTRSSSRSRRHLARRAGRGPRRVVFVVILLLVLFGTGIGASFLTLNVIMAGQADLPKLDDQQAAAVAQTSQIFAADGSSLAYLFGEVNRTVVPRSDLSPFLRYAVVAIEDKRFYQHEGVDYVRLGRAIEINLRASTYAQGASTITQQLVGSLYLDRRDITLTRKVREASLALQYEQRYSKEEILTQYLNTVYFGANAYGAEAAAQTYFGKGPNELSVAEAALLAGLPQAPSAYNPRRNPDKALYRRNEVLGVMWEQGYITEEQYDEAYDTPIKLVPQSPYYQVREPYVVDYVKQQLIAMFGKEKVFQGGLRVQTTIEPKWQDLARKAIKSVLNQKNDPSAALVSIDPNTGYIRAMASSGDYDKSKFNLAAQMHRQPGSAFKPFCLVTALEQGMNPVTTVYQSGPQAIRLPGSHETWMVNNFSDGYYGSSNLVEATIHSDNSIYAQLIMDVGVKNVVNVAKAMGIKSPINANPSIVLGGLTYGVSPLDMASAYGTLAAGGRLVEPTIITKVWDVSGKVIYEAEPKVSQAISPRTAFTATQILEQNIKRGTGRRADIGRPCAGKTGTASDFSDAWFAGYTPHLSTAVWVGHPKGRIPMRSVHGISVTGGSFPAMIWRNFMYEADRTYAAGGFPGPNGVETGAAPVVAGTESTTTESTITESTTTTKTTTKAPKSRRTTTTVNTGTTQPPNTTTPPTTAPPVTSPPTTAPPATSPPTTSPPATQPPTTVPPATGSPPT